MGNNNAILTIVRELSIKHHHYKITLESLKNYGKTRINVENNGLTAKELFEIDAILKELEAEGKVRLEYIDSMMHRVIFVDYFIERVRQTYLSMVDDPHIPFPTPEMFKQDIPQGQVAAVDVKSEFVSFLESADEHEGKILRLILPQFEYSLLVLPSMLTLDLLHRAVDKIRAFLEKESNHDYIRSRVLAAMKKEESGVRLMMKKIQTKPEDIFDSIYNSSPFSFSFWSHLASSVIKEYQSKKSTYVDDYVYAQAAYLIGFYNVYYKGKNQKIVDKDGAFQQLNLKLRRDPYCYSLQDIYAFQDENGVDLLKICGKNEYNGYITKMISEVDNHGISELIMVKTAKGKEFFISKNVFVQFMLKEIGDASSFFKNEIIVEWKEALEHYDKLDEMKSEAAFEKSLKNRIKKQRPILSGMLDYKMISAMLHNDKVKESEKLELSAMMDNGNNCLVLYSRILNLDRAGLLSEVKISVPVYKSNSMLRAIVTLFGKFFGILNMMKNRDRPKKKKKKDSMEFTKTTTDIFVAAVSDLKNDFIGEQGDIELSMDQLINRWNPLIDTVAKANLVEDVNSLIRDYIRKIRKSFLFAAPDRERVESMANRLSENSAFSHIKNKEALKRYIELYMIDILSNMKLMK